VAGQVEERVHPRDRHALGVIRHLDDLVARPNLALLEHAHVEPGPAARNEQRGHPWLVHADPDAVAGHARLCHLEDRSPDAIPVTDAHLVIGQALDGEVLAELSKREATSAKFLLPEPVRGDLVDEYRPLLAPVASQVALPVAVDVEPPHHAPASHGRLPDRRVNGPAVPRDVARKAHVH
jgi:hypothetical protein